ncbi:CAP domain-containing protein [Phytomonospora sp. NPDC050363]|uniref:CAP domain-containing protein n=1 Tax=Phytomonospora sp. NPDC050363 TaxID=3155642 RepID=UPI00340D5A68
MSSPTPRARRHSDDPSDRDPADRAPARRSHSGAHRLQRHGAWLSRLGAAALVLLLAGLIAAWFTGALPLRGQTQTDDAATDLPFRVDPSVSAGDDKASRDDRDGGSAEPEPSDTGSEGEDEDDPPPPDEDLSEAEQLAAEAVRLTNVERENAGCAAVKVNKNLTAAALGHSRDMADNDYFDHNSQDGRTPWDRSREAGYDNAIGENIAAGYTSAAAVIEGWMNSEGHRANLLNCDAKAIGLGVASRDGGQLYWTQMFGSA